MVMVAEQRAKQMGLEGIAKNHMVSIDTAFSGKYYTGRRGRPANSKATGLIIGGRWKVYTDGDMNVIIAHKTKTGWVDEAFVSTLSAAFTWLVNKEVRQSDLSDLKAAVARIEQLRVEIIGIAAG